MSQTEIPSAAPGRGYQRYQSEIDAAIAAVLESGTDALELALRSLRIG